MTDQPCAAPLAFSDIVDYWAGELEAADESRVEEHVFACAACARALEDAETLARGIAALPRAGRLHSVVTDAILNRLAADGVRIRTFTVDGSGVVPCAVWADDDLVVTRIRGDFAGAPAVTIEARQATGEPISRLSDVAVRPGQHEILNAIPAFRLRQLPATRVTLTVTAQGGVEQRTILECTLEHGGAFERSSAAR